MEIPAGFELDTIQIDETSIDVLRPSGKKDTAEYYLFYGMDSSGLSTWYVYDTKYSTVQRFFFDGTVDENFSAVQTESQTVAASANARTSTFNDNLKTVIVIISLVLCVVCLAIAIVSVSRKNK
jgi:hypothetical protein